jgi:hypothetical protein
MIKLDIGLLVIGYSRADMFEKAARSFKNFGLPKGTPCYGVIDGSREVSGLAFDKNKKVQECGRLLLNEGVLSKLTIRPKNLGTMKNVFMSVTEVLKRHEFIFVLEDDLEVLPIAEGAIEPLVDYLGGATCAFGIYCNKSFTDKVFLSQRFSSQAWGTSRTCWKGFNLEYIMSLEMTAELSRELRKNVGGDLIPGFKAFQNGKLDSWAIPWNIYNLLEGRFMVYLPTSYVKNNSHKVDAERTYGIEFEYEIGDRSFVGIDRDKPHLNQDYLRHFSIMSRVKRRLRAEFIKWLDLINFKFFRKL